MKLALGVYMYPGYDTWTAKQMDAAAGQAAAYPDTIMVNIKIMDLLSSFNNITRPSSWAMKTYTKMALATTRLQR